MVCMKKIAVLSDIHGNYIAFQKCLEYVLGMGIRAFIFLGDYLGEFPYPQKTMEILYSLKEKYTCFFLQGNKEDYWISRKYDKNCVWKNGNSTVGAMKYCYKNLTDKDIGFFESFPLCREITLTGQAQSWRAMVRRIRIMKKCFRMVKIQKGSWKGVQGSIFYAGIPMFWEAFPMKERFC